MSEKEYTQSEVYRAFKNFVHNGMQISADDIKKMIDESMHKMLEKLIEEKVRHLLEGEGFDNTLKYVIMKYVNEKKFSDGFYGTMTFGEFLKQIITDIVKTQALGNLKIDIHSTFDGQVHDPVVSNGLKRPSKS